MVTELDCYRDSHTGDSVPVAKNLSESVMTIPMYAGLSDEDADKITEIIAKEGRNP